MGFTAKARMASLTDTDRQALSAAAENGFIVAEIYSNGELDPSGFEQYLALQELSDRGLLRCQDGLCGRNFLSGEAPAPTVSPNVNVWRTYVLTEKGEAVIGRSRSQAALRAA